MATREGLSERYFAISHRLLRQAGEELHQKGDTLQASEKIWGAAAHALKSVAVQRGWNHKSHPLLGDIAMQLRLEFGSIRLYHLFSSLESTHNNYYEHRWGEDQVEEHLNWVGEFVQQLNEIRQLPPRRFTPTTRTQERRLFNLTRPRPAESDDDLDISTLPSVDLEPPDPRAAGG